MFHLSPLEKDTLTNNFQLQLFYEHNYKEELNQNIQYLCPMSNSLPITVHTIKSKLIVENSCRVRELQKFLKKKSIGYMEGLLGCNQYQLW